MSSDKLERLRQHHEDIETLVQLSATALQSRSDPANPHPRLNALPAPLKNVREAEQLAADLITSAREHASALKKAYESEERLTEDHAEPTSVFYAALRELRDVHRLSSSSTAMSDFSTGTGPSMSSFERDKGLLATFQPAQFSGEEGTGRSLDLQPFFHQYVNLTKDTSLHYYQFVRDKLASFDHIPSALRCSLPYERYLDGILAYLTDFALRAHPIDETDQHIEQHRLQCDKAFSAELEELKSKYKSLEELSSSLDAQDVKDKLFHLALKTGGRPDDRVKRLWDAATNLKYGRAALLQEQVKFFATSLLDEEMSATVANIQKKLSLSYEEIEAERKAEEDNLGAAIEEDGKDQIESTIYNPKDVPLGWDGKPIPYWMYKLHGLNHEFKCEICGGATYKGPRLFERHFRDAVHLGGLRRLGISYSKAFMMITRIQDAIQLHERLTNREKDTQFDSEREVEVEDDKGNVMNLKTFHDLKRQGLI